MVSTIPKTLDSGFKFTVAIRSVDVAAGVAIYQQIGVTLQQLLQVVAIARALIVLKYSVA